MLRTKRMKAQFLGHGLLLIVPSTTMMKGGAETLTRTELSKNTIPAAQFTEDTTVSFAPGDSVSKESPVTPKPLADDPGLLRKVQLSKHSAPFVRRYVRSEAESLEKIRMRSNVYFRIIDSVFTKYHLPLELKYLAVIESELKTDAYSHVGASGAWQLMPTTARDLGLKVNRKQDERRYFYKSTVAAAKYLRALYAEFGDWLLVIAAYNSGPGPIYKAIHKSGSKNFWVLQRYLPAESRAHVKRFIGAHYYFEGTGSATTCTREEAANLYKTVANVSK